MSESDRLSQRMWHPNVVYQRRIRPLVAAKLGKCSRCLRSATWLTLGSWLLVILLLVAGSGAPLLGLAALIAVASSTLLLAHLIAFSRWMGGNLLVAQRALPPGSVQPWTRREWMMLLTRLTFAHFVATILGR